jgi:hypothetical protein
MEPKGETWASLLLERLKFFGAAAVCLLADGAFLLIWFAVHWLLHYAFDRFNLTGFEKTVGDILRIILEIPLLLTVVIFIIADVWKVALRVFSGVRKELQTENE